ncbi:exodeoxyribonuclease VII small subunit [Enterococcus timonensis]|uniref:exodeoxyribonuclease VII small subunit n=1 Tax=Enterococcus timonensis TaxID=1852364 RepID=UPI0008DB1888|nr:exodeoxyribonuclease VII small subunit [Enterococcus timonensis]
MVKEEKKAQTFEENLQQLELIVRQLESGDVPLEEALTAFQQGISLTKTLQKTLANAEETLTKIMTENGEEVFAEDK